MRTLAVAVALMSACLMAKPALAQEEPAPLRWAKTTRSPQLARPGHDAALYQVCGAPDAGLMRVARTLATRLTRGQAPPEQAELDTMLRQAGLPYVFPRAWGLVGETDGSKQAERLAAWVKRVPPKGQLRCGVAQGVDRQGRPLLAALVVDALADLEPLPTETTAASWLSLDARARQPVHDVEVALLGPRGRPRRVLAELSPEGRIRSRFRLDRPGRWLIQVLATTASGPEPLLETWVFVDAHPSLPERATLRAVQPDRSGLRDLLAQARAQHRAPALRSDGALRRLAEQHARAMLRTRRVAHDVGAGGPRERADALGIASANIGENVASAPTIARVHQALWQSPTHRENMLDPNFRRVGVAAIRDEQGRFWAVQVFAP